MSDSAPPPTRPTSTRRPRVSSFSEAITQVPQNANSNDDHVNPSLADDSVNVSPSIATKPSGGAGSKTVQEDDIYKSQGLFKDIATFRWMTAPASSARLASIFILSYFNWNLFMNPQENPFRPFLMLSHPAPLSQVIVETQQPLDPTSIQYMIQNLIPRSAESHLVRYQKGYFDLCFLAFYVIVFSFLRQVTTLYMFKPFAKWWGIKSETKQARFTEQGYAVLYWGSAAAFGLYVMSFQDNWWFQLEHLWLKYPHWQMRSELKLYYLLQFSYWLQQALIMLLRLEKPRKDYYELIAHHLVTLWLIGWSYLINLTMIGTTVFVCMDIPDTWLGLSKALNYLSLDKLATVIFAIFMFIWTYFRIYLSTVTLQSVWNEYDLVPDYTKVWNPDQGLWLVWWIKFHVFIPLFLLLLLNLFWYALMWRILFRALNGTVADEREEGEDDEDEEETKKDQ